MSPAYNSQLVSNSPLQSIGQDAVVPVLVFSAETPVAGEASLAVAIQPRTASGGPAFVTVQLECPLGIGSGAFQVQDADVDAASAYDSINFGGASPGSIATGNLNASGTGRVELQVAAKFLRILCTTAPSNPVTVRVSLK
jgi:hypothetical protein